MCPQKWKSSIFLSFIPYLDITNCQLQSLGHLFVYIVVWSTTMIRLQWCSRTFKNFGQFVILAVLVRRKFSSLSFQNTTTISCWLLYTLFSTKEVEDVHISDVPVLQFPVFGRSRSSPYRSSGGPVFFASVFRLFFGLFEAFLRH